MPPANAELSLRASPGSATSANCATSLEHAVIVARGGPLLPEHFPTATVLPGGSPREQLGRAVLEWVQDRIRQAAPSPPLNLYEELLSVIEPPLFEEVIRRLQGNRWAAAQWLGLNRATVRKKLQAYELADLFKPTQRDTDDD